MGSNGKMFRELQAEAEKIIAEFGEQTIWLVLAGDWGGQIYLTIPWKALGRKARIATLLAEIDYLAWRCNEGDGRYAYLYWKDAEHMEIEREEGCPCGVSGGMGGGDLDEKEPWVHEDLLQSRPLAGDLGKYPEIADDHEFSMTILLWAARVAELLDFRFLR